MDTNDQYGGKPILNTTGGINPDQYGVKGDSVSLAGVPLNVAPHGSAGDADGGLKKMSQMQLNKHIIKELKYLGANALIMDDIMPLRQAIVDITGEINRIKGTPSTEGIGDDDWSSLRDLTAAKKENETQMDLINASTLPARMRDAELAISGAAGKAESALTRAQGASALAATADGKAGQAQARAQDGWNHAQKAHDKIDGDLPTTMQNLVEGKIREAVGAVDNRINALIKALGFDEGVEADGVTPTAGPVWDQTGGYKKKRKTRKKKNKRRSKRS